MGKKPTQPRSHQTKTRPSKESLPSNDAIDRMVESDEDESPDLTDEMDLELLFIQAGIDSGRLSLESRRQSKMGEEPPSEGLQNAFNWL